MINVRYTYGIKNKVEDQYPLIYLSIILKSYLARKRRLADGDTQGGGIRGEIIVLTRRLELKHDAIEIELTSTVRFF